MSILGLYEIPDTTAEEKLADEGPSWIRGRSKRNGQPFFVIPSRSGPRVYYTTNFGCTCRGFLHRGYCAHVGAVRLYEAELGLEITAKVCSTLHRTPR